MQILMLAQSSSDVVHPTHPFLAKNGVGPTLPRCCSTNAIQTIYTAQFFMLVQRWLVVVKPTQKRCRFLIFMKHMMILAKCCPYVCSQCQLSASGTTVCQGWPNVVMLSGSNTTANMLDLYAILYIHRQCEA